MSHTQLKEKKEQLNNAHKQRKNVPGLCNTCSKAGVAGVILHMGLDYSVVNEFLLKSFARNTAVFYGANTTKKNLQVHANTAKKTTAHINSTLN